MTKINFLDFFIILNSGFIATFYHSTKLLNFFYEVFNSVKSKMIYLFLVNSIYNASDGNIQMVVYIFE